MEQNPLRRITNNELHELHLLDLEAEKADTYPYIDSPQSGPHQLPDAQWGFRDVFPSTGHRRGWARNP